MLKRYFLSSVGFGALLGLARAWAGTAVWLSLGRPDFYMRPVPGQIAVITMILDAFVIGVPLGVLLCLIEKAGKKRINLLPLYGWTLLLATLLAGIYAYYAITWRTLRFAWVNEFAPLIIAVLLIVFRGRRSSKAKPVLPRNTFAIVKGEDGLGESGSRE